MTKLDLDRMTIEDVGMNPRLLAEAVHKQLPNQTGAVPVREVALALDIQEIREAPLTNLEAALVTTPERDRGSILLNSRSSRQRQRFSLSHELLHFLNPMHEQTSPDGFRCSRADMLVSTATNDRHLRQESEANTFAIELLAPRLRLKPFLRGTPDLKKILTVAGEFEISRESAARRYVQLHGDCLAVIFTKARRLIYLDRTPDFPFIDVRPGQECNVDRVPEGKVSDIEEVEASNWLSQERLPLLTAQTLGQANGYAITLLRADLPEDEDSGIDDSFEHFRR